jgi:hypothetical protein
MNNQTLPADNIVNQKSYAYRDIKKAFDYISHDAHLEFDFAQGGCQQRSHAMSLILFKKFNIEHSKVWLFAPAALDENDMRSLFIDDVNKLSPDNIVNWNYHTAPIVKLNKGDKVEMIVMDPSLDRKAPLLLEDWLKAIGNSNISKYTFLAPEKYFFNCKYNDNSQLTNVFDGTFFEYINPAKDNLVIEKGLAVNDMTMTIYKKHIKPLMTAWVFKDNDKLQDLKDIFGNATALDLLFAQNLSGNTDNTFYRYVLTHHGDIMKEAKQIFHERLLFWTKFTNELI